jgi:hypothetical protein
MSPFSAVFTKANVQKGHNVLITGIGGGVAITALQYCVALGWFNRSTPHSDYFDSFPSELQAPTFMSHLVLRTRLLGLLNLERKVE